MAIRRCKVSCHSRGQANACAASSQTTFFKLQVRDDKLGEDLPQNVSSELDLSFSKMERMVMDKIAASSDRVVVHQALKHLIVGGNALIFMGKDGLKNFPVEPLRGQP